MSGTEFWMLLTFRVSLYVVCVSPHNFYFQTVWLLINFAWYFLPLFNLLFFLSSIVTLQFKIRWRSRPQSRLKLVKITDPTSNVYIITSLVPGKCFQQGCHSSRLNYWYYQFVYIPDTGRFSGVWMSLVLGRPKSEIKHTIPATKPLRTTRVCSEFECVSLGFSSRKPRDSNDSPVSV